MNANYNISHIITTARSETHITSCKLNELYLVFPCARIPKGRLNYDTCKDNAHPFEDGEWFVDIVKGPNGLEAWLQHKDYGISELMFGSNEMTYEDFLFTAEWNLYIYKYSYTLRHCD